MIESNNNTNTLDLEERIKMIDQIIEKDKKEEPVSNHTQPKSSASPTRQVFKKWGTNYSGSNQKGDQYQESIYQMDRHQNQDNLSKGKI